MTEVAGAGPVASQEGRKNPSQDLLAKISQQKCKFRIVFRYKKQPYVTFWVRSRPGGDVLVGLRERGVDAPHYHIYRTSDLLGHHIKDEPHEMSGPVSRRFKGARPMGEVLRQLCLALARPSDPPPDESAFSDPGRRKDLEEWVGRTVVRHYRQPGPRLVYVPPDSAEALAKELMGPAPPSTWTIDLDDSVGLRKRLRQLRRSHPEQFLLDRMSEKQFAQSGRKLAVDTRMHNVIIGVSPDLVIEANLRRVQSVITYFKKHHDLQRFFNELEERDKTAYERLDEAVNTELRSR
jgi:hypothetical protein